MKPTLILATLLFATISPAQIKPAKAMLKLILSISLRMARSQIFAECSSLGIKRFWIGTKKFLRACFTELRCAKTLFRLGSFAQTSPLLKHSLGFRGSLHRVRLPALTPMPKDAFAPDSYR
jgi:hypothetical protein